MRKIIALLLAFLAINAYTNDYYVGIGAHKITSKDTLNNIELKYDEINPKLVFGMPIDDEFSAEFHYTNLKDSKVTDTPAINLSTGAVGQLTANFKGRSLGISGIYKFAVDEDITPFARLGFHNWKLDGSANFATATPTATVVSSDGTDIFYGVGVDFLVSDNIIIRPEVERYKWDSDWQNNYGVNVLFSF